MSEQDQVTQRPVVPREYAGKWIAWSRDGLRIVASGDSLQAVQRAAAATDEQDVGYEWVPPATTRIIGAGR
ncbi:MAG: hypothetical protein HY000_30910 [Planctomycetes bacterium]|nr:hypothetical protein [Planctomycetota bacterium]